MAERRQITSGRGGQPSAAGELASRRFFVPPPTNDNRVPPVVRVIWNLLAALLLGALAALAGELFGWSR
ncbi:MAG: hypothetical protein ACT4P2_09965 [Pseudomonadota bacterium]